MSGLLKFGEQKRIIEQQKKKNKKPAWELNYNLNDTLCVIEFIIQEEEQRNNWFRTIRSHNNLDSECERTPLYRRLINETIRSWSGKRRINDKNQILKILFRSEEEKKSSFQASYHVAWFQKGSAKYLLWRSSRLAELFLIKEIFKQTKKKKKKEGKKSTK